MNADTRRQIITAAHQREIELIDTKGREYTGGAETGNDLDTLANFKRVAERTGLSPTQVWGVYFLKHVDAITTYLQDPTREVSEPIGGRIDDARTYLGLLECLLVDLDPVQARNAKPYELLLTVEVPAVPDGARSVDEIATEAVRASAERRLANHVSLAASAPRRCDMCTGPLAENCIAHDERRYCSAPCARLGEERNRLANCECTPETFCRVCAPERWIRREIGQCELGTCDLPNGHRGPHMTGTGNFIAARKSLEFPTT